MAEQIVLDHLVETGQRAESGDQISVPRSSVVRISRSRNDSIVERRTCEKPLATFHATRIENGRSSAYCRALVRRSVIRSPQRLPPAFPARRLRISDSRT